ncbi:MAG: hypothetical protein PHR06_01905 [Candidatus Cloacimonetes bacterium]|nr:hypothetical protein [Candidatus Cloacimonadota bacterium]
MKLRLLTILLILSVSLMAYDVELLFNPTTMTYNYFPVGSLDPDDIQMPFFASATLTNSGTEDISQYQLVTTITWDQVPIVENVLAKSKNPLVAGQQIVINSNDVFNNSSLKFDVDFDQNDFINDDFEDKALELGALPDGIYQITVLVRDMNDYQLSEPATFTLIISNPVPLRLIYPGASSVRSNVDVMTQYPNFLWVTNMSKCTLFIYELAEDNDLIDNPDNLEVFFTETFSEEDVPGSFIYPVDAPQLEPGRLYAWRVTAGLISLIGSGDDVVDSELFYFRITDEGSEVNDKTFLDAVLNMSNQEIREYLDKLLQSGYSPTGKIYFGSRELTIEELQEILDKINSNTMEIKSITIE